MKKITCKYIFTTAAFALLGARGMAQDIRRTLPDSLDPHTNKIIPDKVFEIGIPFLLFFFLISALVQVFRIRSDARLKEKALEKGLSEETLRQLFSAQNTWDRVVYLKWFLILAALAVAFLSIHFIGVNIMKESPYLALGIMATAMALAFLIYYRLISKK